MGLAARRLAEERYSWADIAARLEAVYERVIAAPAGEARAA
jgi:glycosyltransferase involved in cell wall biosynthesis